MLNQCCFLCALNRTCTVAPLPPPSQSTHPAKCGSLQIHATRVGRACRQCCKPEPRCHLHRHVPAGLVSGAQLAIIVATCGVQRWCCDARFTWHATGNSSKATPSCNSPHAVTCLLKPAQPSLCCPTSTRRRLQTVQDTASHSPQHHAWSSLSSAQVKPSPQVRARNARPPATATGVVELTLSPVPSWLNWLSPCKEVRSEHCGSWRRSTNRCAS